MRFVWRSPKFLKTPQLKSGYLIALAIVFAFAGLLFIATSFIERQANTQAEKIIDKAMINLPPQLEVSYSHADISLWRQSFSLLGVRVQNVLIDRVRVWGIDWDSLSMMLQTRKAVLPREIKIELSGIHISPDVLGEQGAVALQMLGYEQILASVYASLGLNTIQKTLDVHELVIEAPKVGRLEAKAAITSFILPTSDEIARLKKDPRLFLTDDTELTKAALKYFEIRYIDDSLVRRATTALVQAGEDSPEALVQLAIDVNEPSARVIASSPNPASINDFTKPALAKLLKFVREPRSITLRSAPPKPIPFVSILDEKTSGSINDLAHRLSLSVE